MRGGLQTFATGERWQRDNGESRQSNCHGSGGGAALRKAAVSPLWKYQAAAACARGMKSAAPA
jgi:hypothetical protein